MSNESGVYFGVVVVCERQYDEYDEIIHYSELSDSELLSELPVQQVDVTKMLLVPTNQLGTNLHSYASFVDEITHSTLDLLLDSFNSNSNMLKARMELTNLNIKFRTTVMLIQWGEY